MSEKLYIVVDERLPIPQQGIQAAHALSAWALAHPGEHAHWAEVDNSLVILKAPIQTISAITWELNDQGKSWVVFREPFYKYRITAVALTPGHDLPMLKTLPLALKDPT